MKEIVYDHVLRVWPPLNGDLRAGPFGAFAGVSHTSKLFDRGGSTASIASAPLLVTDSKDRRLSDLVVELHFVHLFEGPGDVLSPSAMEKLVAAQMRVIVKVNDDSVVGQSKFVVDSGLRASGRERGRLA